jgi:hypothetical protein
MIECTKKTTLEEWGGVFGGAGTARITTYSGHLLAFDFFQWNYDYLGNLELTRGQGG